MAHLSRDHFPPRGGQDALFSPSVLLMALEVISVSHLRYSDLPGALSYQAQVAGGGATMTGKAHLSKLSCFYFLESAWLDTSRMAKRTQIHGVAASTP